MELVVWSSVEAFGGFLTGRFGFDFVILGGEAHPDGLGDSELFHGDAIHDVGAVHGALAVGHDDELALVDEGVEHFEEAADVGFVEGSIELVQNAEGAGLDLVDGEEQGHGGHGAFATGEKADALELFAGRLGDDFDTGLERVAFV